MLSSVKLKIWWLVRTCKHQDLWALPISPSTTQVMRSMQHRPPDFGQVANFRSAIPMTFPNYTVPLKVLLSMEKMRPHEELMEEDLLVEFDSSMGKAAFISHQWISATNPDPEFAQMKTFQDALKNMLSKGKWIYPDIATEYNTRGRSLHLSELRTKPLFFWYDYFSIPQLLDSKWFVNSLQMCSQDRAIQSIPAYIDRCESWQHIEKVPVASAS